MATLYVNASTGDDSRSYATAQNSATPWATIGRAAWGSTNRAAPNAGAAAAAGDTVNIAAGTYDFSGTVGNNFSPVYNPANAGTLGNPITFQATGTVILTAASADSPVIGAAAGKNYIIWTGPFSIDETNLLVAPDTGPVTFSGCTGSQLVGATLQGRDQSAQWAAAPSDNHNAVRFSGAVSCEVKNCTITGFRNPSDTHNGTGITLYGSSDCLIEHNVITNCFGGVYFKDTSSTPEQSGNIVRLNWIEDCEQPFIWSHVTGGTSVEDRNFVYQNVAVSANFGATFIGATNDWVFNNTFVNCAIGVRTGTAAVGVKVWNNIFAECPIMIYVEGATLSTDDANTDFEHNCYHGFTAGEFLVDSSGDHSFATYLTDYANLDHASPASVDADPLFADQAGGNYRLQAGSPARNLAGELDAYGFTHAGAYQTGNESIGLDSGSVASSGGSNPITLLVLY